MRLATVAESLRKVKIMSDNRTIRIRKALGVQKCNGSWDAAVEELTMDVIFTAKKSSDLTEIYVQ